MGVGDGVGTGESVGAGNSEFNGVGEHVEVDVAEGTGETTGEEEIEGLI